MKTCKTCKHWQVPTDDDSYNADDICTPLDPDTYKPMNRGFEVRLCKMPTQAFAEAPVESNGFALTDASTYLALLSTGEDFGCVRYEAQDLGLTLPITGYQRRRRTDRSAPRPPAVGIPVDWLVRRW